MPTFYRMDCILKWIFEETRKAHSWFAGFILVVVGVSFAYAGAGEGEPATEFRAAAASLAETLGYLPRLSEDAPRIVIRDVEIPIEHPMVSGEQIVLSTVGVEHQGEESVEFHPLVSFLIDKTFPEPGGGEWLAIWNLGHKSPGALSRIRATIPGWTAQKRVRDREYRAVEKTLEQFDQMGAASEMDFPDPLFTQHQKHDRSTAFMVINGIKNVLNFTKIPFPALLLLRTYLIGRKDLQEREFEQAYLGLAWYSDLAMASDGEEALSAEAIEEIKFRLLTNRHLLGRWTDPHASENFVHAFESEMRDHLWGTSCYLASAANEFHLGYEEFHRFTATGVPLALGGLLYYDPELAPELSQVNWSAFNPFDLSYNPFTDVEVQRAAASGDRVPLAVYVYQSNLALKPIITVDFFRPDNPRLRESLTYWRKIGNEALSAWGAFGYFYSWARRGLGFLANRKGLTYFTDKKHSFGIEELRLSLMSHLYFDSASADKLVDRVDRLIINPLVQPARLHGIRSELHYRILLAKDGKGLVSLARRVRGESVRNALGKEPRSRLSAEDYERYRTYLRKKVHIGRLDRIMTDTNVPSWPLEAVVESVQALGVLADGMDDESTGILLRLWVELRSDARVMRASGEDSETLSQSLPAVTTRSLRQIYQAAGRTEADLEADFGQIAEKQEEIRAREKKEREKKHAEEFVKELKVRIEFLRAFLRNGADLNRYSPWYVTEALNFLHEVPAMVQTNPRAAEHFDKRRSDVEQLLLLTERHLASSDVQLRAAWLDAQRRVCLDSVRKARLELATVAAKASFSADTRHREVPTETGKP